MAGSVHSPVHCVFNYVALSAFMEIILKRDSSLYRFVFEQYKTAKTNTLGHMRKTIEIH